MPPDDFRILAINPGSSSTKFAVYLDEREVLVRNLRHSDAEMAPFRNAPVLDQFEFRSALIESELQSAGVNITSLHAVVGRGGLLHPVPSGTYKVNAEMLDELRATRFGEHASNLGAFLAQSIADRAGVSAYIVDPVSVDEWPPIARLSGSSLFDRVCQSHALNTKAVAKRYAREHSRDYEQLRLIVAHLGSGISVSAHEGGKMIDVTNSRHEGAFSAERSGSVPCLALVELCFSGKFARNEIEAFLFREGGLVSYLGTRELGEVEQRILNGDSWAALVFEAMAYQIAKEIGAMATVVRGTVDAILITGGMAHSGRLLARLRSAVEWIAPVITYAGENELRALAEGALRVLRGLEVAQQFGTALAVTR